MNERYQKVLVLYLLANAVVNDIDAVNVDGGMMAYKGGQ